MKILCLIDSCIRPGDRWIWDYLPGNKDQIDFLTTSAPDSYPKWGKVLSYYPGFIHLGYEAYLRTSREKYDCVVAWEGKNGFAYGFFRSIFNLTLPPFVILTYIHRGLIRDFPGLSRFVMKSVSHISVTTDYECQKYAELFSNKTGKISICPLGWYDAGSALAENRQSSRHEKYILASGRSYRDYATLVEAIKGLDLKLVILSRKFNLSGIQLPANVEWLDLLPRNEFWKIMRGAEFVCVPLQPLPHSAGDGHIVQAMSASKAVIATTSPSSITYIEPDITGLLVPPKDVAEMRKAILDLWNNPYKTKQMGKAARERFERCYTFEAFAQRSHFIIKKTVQAAELDCLP